MTHLKRYTQLITWPHTNKHRFLNANQTNIRVHQIVIVYNWVCNILTRSELKKHACHQIARRIVCSETKNFLTKTMDQMSATKLIHFAWHFDSLSKKKIYWSRYKMPLMATESKIRINAVCVRALIRPDFHFIWTTRQPTTSKLSLFGRTYRLKNQQNYSLSLTHSFWLCVLVSVGRLYHLRCKRLHFREFQSK